MRIKQLLAYMLVSILLVTPIIAITTFEQFKEVAVDKVHRLDLNKTSYFFDNAIEDNDKSELILKYDLAEYWHTDRTDPDMFNLQGFYINRRFAGRLPEDLVASAKDKDGKDVKPEVTKTDTGYKFTIAGTDLEKEVQILDRKLYARPEVIGEHVEVIYNIEGEPSDHIRIGFGKGKKITVLSPFAEPIETISTSGGMTDAVYDKQTGTYKGVVQCDVPYKWESEYRNSKGEKYTYECSYSFPITVKVLQNKGNE